MQPPFPPIRIRDAEDGRAALRFARERGCAVVLVSDPGAAGFAGAGWWAALTALLRAEFTGQDFIAILDCADAPGQVLAAVRAGVADVAFAGAARVRLESLCAGAGVRLHPPPAGAIDLRGERDRLAGLRRRLPRTIDSRSM